MKASIVWNCEQCREPIEDDEGYVTIHYGELGEYKRAVKAWEAEHAKTSAGFTLYDGAALLAHPEPPRWQVLHCECDPQPDSGDDYWIGVERIRTPAQAIHWTAHLLGKTWLPDTNWRAVLHTVARQLDPEGRL
jgi:hypothetical protein